MEITPTEELRGEIRVPGDKSISHRAALVGALAEGTTEIEGFLASDDCVHTLQCLRDLGVSVRTEFRPEYAGGEQNRVFIEGRGLRGLHEPVRVLDAGNSGTTMRLLSGILAGQPFTSFLTGDVSLCNRPMERVTVPLREMGAKITGRQGGTRAPLAITGGNLQALNYHLPVASAQVKSALLLAGLFASGWTVLSAPGVSRNHTELMLQSFGAELTSEMTGAGEQIAVKGLPVLRAQRILVPGDLSSAAFLMVAALIVPYGKLTIKSVGLNPTRDGIIEVLQAMGASLRITEQQQIAGEQMGTIEVESSSLRGISIGGDIIPRLIDEIPILAVAALYAEGVTEIRNAAELKVKETNRLATICAGLTRMGAKIEELPDGLRIYGGHALQGSNCRSFGDHRIAMALAVAALGARGKTVLEEAECVDISFPGFWAMLAQLRSGK
jgi:3-phosphoshikimate 1-carboxyvinyltransferase